MSNLPFKGDQPRNLLSDEPEPYNASHAATAPGGTHAASLAPHFNIPSQTSSDIEKYHSPDDVAVEAGGVKRPTKQAIPDLPKPNFIKRMFGKKGKKDEDDVPDKKEKHYIPAAIPDPSREEMGPFPLFPSQLNGLVDPKSVDKLTEMGGLTGLSEKLHTDLKTGLTEGGSADTSIESRRRIYGQNKLPTKKPKSLLYLMAAAMKDKVLILLSVAAVISLALGIYQAVGVPPHEVNGVVEPQVEWVEGVAIIAAITIVVMVGSLNDWQKERQFAKLNAQKEERNVKVTRGGTEQLMNVYDVVVGDVLTLEPGEIVPVDGCFLEGHNIKCDESSATGESDAIKKLPYDELMKAREAGEAGKADCFVLSGSKVIEGSGRYVATSVGKHSYYGKIMMSLQRPGEVTPLQLKLNRLAETIAKLAATAGLILFACLMIRFFVGLAQNPNRTSDEKAANFIDILIIAVTLIVVAVPEGLPLAVTLALAFATRRMTKENLLVRVLSSCETMANATVICTDKTGTLTQNKMSVVAGSVGVHLKFADRLAENAGRSNANVDEKPAPRRGRKDFSLDMAELNRAVTGPVRKLFNDSIAINSTAFEGKDEMGNMGFVGSKTETALLAFSKALGWKNYDEVRKTSEVIQAYPFSSVRKASAVVVRLANGGARVFFKGASEILQKKSTHHVHVGNPSSQSYSEADSAAAANEDGEVRVAEFNPETLGNIERTIIFYANQSLRTIALCYRDFPSWPPPGMAMNEAGELEWDDLARNMTLVAITAIEDPLRPGVTESVATCRTAGVAVKMCTGDNVLTARSIATQCGIYTPGGLIMEGPHFRTLNEQQMGEVVPRLQVLARSSPTDKETLVAYLMKMGEVTCVTGDGMNDGPALKTANVGFAMGIAGTEIAKEASDIILMDDNFASIVTAIMWGRCVNDSVKKFLQFQISVNITAVILTFVTAVASDSEESVLTAVQLLWVNLIMDTFAALALATDPATPESLQRKPDAKLAPLISPDMWKMIIGQSIFQLVVAFVLHFVGPSIFNVYDPDPLTNQHNEERLSTLVFNTFVFCQIFNALNARVLGRKLNIFAGFLKNKYFMGIWAIMIGGQILIVFVGGAAFSARRISGVYWAISIIIGALSLPIAVLIRLLPTAPFERMMIKMKLYPDPNALPTVTPAAAHGDWNEGITKVFGDLTVLSTIKGGRHRGQSISFKTKASRLEKAGVHTSSLLAMVPSLIMSSVGAAWRPNDEGGSLSDPAGIQPNRGTTSLTAGNIQCHPESDPNDPLIRKLGLTVGEKQDEKRH